MKVEYAALDRSGREVIDTMDAPDIRSAVEALRKRDLFVTEITENTGTKRRRDEGTREKETDEVGQVRLPIRQLALFTRQMSMMLTSGSGVVPALNSIARQFTKPLHARLIRHLAQDLEEGSTLTESLRKYPRTFDSTYRAVIAAGEASGSLTEMFSRLSTIVGKRRVMRNKVLGAMAYPALLIVLSLSIVMVLLLFVMPRFGTMFTTLDVPLPASTELLIALGEFARNHWLPCVAAGGAVIGAIVCALLSSVVRQWLSGVSIHIPVIRRVVSGLIQGESFRILGMLIEARVGVLEAIHLVRGVTSNMRYQELYRAMESEVTEGGSISQAMEASGLVAPPICQAVRTGEENGALGGALSYVADVLDEDNSELIGAATKLLEPAILIVMGLVVGGVAVSLFLPMFDMTSAIR